ncbi:MAG: 50S ribosomal protein L10 [Phycisphaerales bacterium]|nr:50S ribosomal protein L10 [Phycisphaerales bacterium]
MSKPIKDMMTAQLRERYAGVDSALWVDFVGCPGVTNNEFRRALHGRQMRLEIIKTSLLRRAVAGSKLEPLAKSVSGPAALVTGGESAIDIARAVEEWLPKIKGMKLRGAMLDGELLGDRDVAGLAKMAGRRELQAGIASAVRAPGGKLAAAILAGGGAIAACVKSLIEKLEKGEGVGAAPAAAAEAAPAAAAEAAPAAPAAEPSA